jgi:hypothetical protein
LIFLCEGQTAKRTEFSPLIRLLHRVREKISEMLMSSSPSTGHAPSSTVGRGKEEDESTKSTPTRARICGQSREKGGIVSSHFFLVFLALSLAASAALSASALGAMIT